MHHEVISTERLILRDWQDSDLEPWAALNADPEVREHLGPVLPAAAAAASVRKFQEQLDRNGFGFWAVEIRATGEFIGCAGLDPVDARETRTIVVSLDRTWASNRSLITSMLAVQPGQAASPFGSNMTCCTISWRSPNSSASVDWSLHPFEQVFLLDPDHRQPPPLRVECRPGVSLLLLLREQEQPGLQPLGARDNLRHRHLSLLEVDGPAGHSAHHRRAGRPRLIGCRKPQPFPGKVATTPPARRPRG